LVEARGGWLGKIVAPRRAGETEGVDVVENRVERPVRHGTSKE
jgi:hypothetical protein